MSAEHFTWFHKVPAAIGLPAEIHSEFEKLLMGIVVGAALIIASKAATAKIRSAVSEDVIPPEKQFSLFCLFDLILEAFVAFHDSILGKEKRKYLSLSASVFLFILCSNLLGLVPGMATPTTTVWVNLSMAITVFVFFNYLGFKEHGFWGYLKHFWGPVWWIGPFLFVMEVMSTFLRIVTLNLRLYWNITADHMVLSAFNGLAPTPVPVLVYGLGVFVSVMQAFVFTILTMMYILLATQHEEEH